MPTADIQTVLAQLVGQRCEGVDNPYGSILRLDIGPLGVRADEPGSKPHGWRHLTIESPWRLASSREVICDWNDDGGAEGGLTSLIAPILGRTVLEARAAPPAWDLLIRLSGDLDLFVFSDSDDQRDDAWVVLGTDGLSVSVGPKRGVAGGVTIKQPLD